MALRILVLDPIDERVEELANALRAWGHDVRLAGSDAGSDDVPASWRPDLTLGGAAAVAGPSEPVGEFDAAAPLMSRSPAMRQAIDLMRRVAPSSASVLITGESGSGKDFVAQALHDLSTRSDAPFVAVSCPAIPETLLESELFGHQRGSFTGAFADRPGLFERAAGGTLFLDEITEMSLGLQAKLLRVLESRRFRRIGAAEERTAEFRVFAATNRDPDTAVREGRLREDLYYRLNVFHLHVPPLRERREDVVALAVRFANTYSAQNARAVEGFTNESLAALETYDWPGNVRELRNVIERAVVLARHPVIGLEDLPPAVARGSRRAPPSREPGIEPLAEVERRAILEALESTGHNKSRAARALGISLKTLRAKLRQYGYDGAHESGSRSEGGANA